MLTTTYNHHNGPPLGPPLGPPWRCRHVSEAALRVACEAGAQGRQQRRLEARLVGSEAAQQQRRRTQQLHLGSERPGVQWGWVGGGLVLAGG